MTGKKISLEPAKTIAADCDVVILGIKRTILKISSHLWKRNQEFQTSKKTKIKQNLTQYLLSKKEIRDFVQQLHNKEPEDEGIDKKNKNFKYYGYQPVIDARNDMKYRIIWLHDDDNPELIGVITVYPYE